VELSDLKASANPYREDKVYNSCAIFGVMDVSRRCFSGDRVFAAMENMFERGNGLGAGFAVYGLYPEMPDHYALHVMFTSPQGRPATEEFLTNYFRVDRSEPIPTRKTPGISGEPQVWRYFLKPLFDAETVLEEEDFVVDKVLQLNTSIADSFAFSCGKNMGVFKGVGYPEQIAHFYRLEEYQGYIWTAHSRFPTNSQAWWGGAHPFCLINWSVVHNGEISSYGANRAFLETLGYRCTLFTDTEVMAYAVDLLMRRQGFSPDAFAKVVAPPFWDEIDSTDAEQRALHAALRIAYGGLLMNGPFAVVIANQDQMIALTDRIRLRPLTVATCKNMFYVSSEEASIRLVARDPDHIWTPRGGVPVVSRIGLLPKPNPETDNVGAGAVSARGGNTDEA